MFSQKYTRQHCNISLKLKKALSLFINLPKSNNERHHLNTVKGRIFGTVALSEDESLNYELNENMISALFSEVIIRFNFRCFVIFVYK